MEKKKKIAACKDGKHTFIVSNWQVGAGRQKAIHMLCQHCLMPIDLVEIRNAKWFESESKEAK